MVAEFIHFIYPAIRSRRERFIKRKKERLKDALENRFQVYQFKADNKVLYEDKRQI
jgi:hypothetical protein